MARNYSTPQARTRSKLAVAARETVFAVPHRPLPDPHAAVGLRPESVRRRRAKQKAFREAMERTGTNLTQLAKVIGVDHSYMSRIAGGHRTPSLSTSRMLAEALDMTIDDLAVLLLGPSDRGLKVVRNG